jgi:ribose transport system permease protein
MSTADLTAMPAATISDRLISPIARIMRAYSFAFALVLSVGLLIANLLTTSGGFGLTDQLANFAPMAIAGMASTPAIISGGGGFDLTISPLITLANAVFVAWLVPHSLGGIVAVPIVLLVGAAIGFTNGMLIIGLRVQPVVATLSMYFILIGVDLKVAPYPSSFSNGWVVHLATTVGPVPGALFTLGGPLLIWYLIGLTPYKRTLYAVGSNDATAYASGVNVARVRVAAYTLGGLFAGFGGIALTALVRSTNASLSTTYALVAIAAVALGGTSLWGGRGGLFGSMLGAACIYLLQNLLTVLQIDPSWLQVMYGGMLIFAVILGGKLLISKVEKA